MSAPNNPFFRGWAKPGPQIPALGEPAPGETLDALSGHYRIFQLEAGHRFSTDDLLTAWYGTLSSPVATRVLDLGSGIGSVGMIAAWRLQGAKFVTIEAQSESVALARKSARYNGIEDRYEIREGDLRDPMILGEGETFDLILGSPPYFPMDSGILGDHPQKIACRFEVRGTIHDYCATASRHLAAGGVFACVFPVNPPHQEKRVLDAAAENGLVIVRRKDVQFKEEDKPLIGLFAMMRAGDLPEAMRSQTWVESPLVIRTKSGQVHPEYSVAKLTVGFPP